MKLLFDQNISFRVAKKPQNHFSGCMHVSDCKLMDTEDATIWEYAKTKDLAIVTFDSDFYDISIINGHPPKRFQRCCLPGAGIIISQHDYQFMIFG